MQEELEANLRSNAFTYFGSGPGDGVHATGSTLGSVSLVDEEDAWGRMLVYGFVECPRSLLRRNISQHGVNNASSLSIHAISISPDGAYLAVGMGAQQHLGWCSHTQSCVLIWTRRRNQADSQDKGSGKKSTNKLGYTFSCKVDMPACVASLAFCPTSDATVDGSTILAVGLYSGELQLWSLREDGEFVDSLLQTAATGSGARITQAQPQQVRYTGTEQKSEAGMEEEEVDPYDDADDFDDVPDNGADSKKTEGTSLLGTKSIEATVGSLTGDDGLPTLQVLALVPHASFQAQRAGQSAEGRSSHTAPSTKVTMIAATSSGDFFHRESVVSMSWIQPNADVGGTDTHPILITIGADGKVLAWDPRDKLAFWVSGGELCLAPSHYSGQAPRTRSTNPLAFISGQVDLTGLGLAAHSSSLAGAHSLNAATRAIVPSKCAISKAHPGSLLVGTAAGAVLECYLPPSRTSSSSLITQTLTRSEWGRWSDEAFSIVLRAPRNYVNDVKTIVEQYCDKHHIMPSDMFAALQVARSLSSSADPTATGSSSTSTNSAFVSSHPTLAPWSLLLPNAIKRVWGMHNSPVISLEASPFRANLYISAFQDDDTLRIWSTTVNGKLMLLELPGPQCEQTTSESASETMNAASPIVGAWWSPHRPCVFVCATSTDLAIYDLSLDSRNCVRVISIDQIIPNDESKLEGTQEGVDREKIRRITFLPSNASLMAIVTTKRRVFFVSAGALGFGDAVLDAEVAFVGSSARLGSAVRQELSILDDVLSFSGVMKDSSSNLE